MGMLNLLVIRRPDHGVVNAWREAAGASDTSAICFVRLIRDVEKYTNIQAEKRAPLW